MPRHALTNHRAVEDIERGEQRGRAVPELNATFACWGGSRDN
jgi:hypothetical protein